MAVIRAFFSTRAKASARLRPAAERPVSEGTWPLIAARSAWRTRKITGGWAVVLAAKNKASRQTKSRGAIADNGYLTIDGKVSGIIRLFRARFSFHDRLSQKILHLSV